MENVLAVVESMAQQRTANVRRVMRGDELKAQQQQLIVRGLPYWLPPIVVLVHQARFMLPLHTCTLIAGCSKRGLYLTSSVHCLIIQAKCSKEGKGAGKLKLLLCTPFNFIIPCAPVLCFMLAGYGTPLYATLRYGQRSMCSSYCVALL